MGTLNKTILIIEDDPFIAMDLEDIFQDAGFNILGPAADLNSGLSLLESQLPDVAMLDFNLGDVNSVPIAQYLARHNIPFAFLSGQMNREIAANDLGEVQILSKPVDPDHLVNTVKSLLRQAA